MLSLSPLRRSLALGEQVPRLNLRSGIERYRERDDLCSDVRRRVLGLESGVGSEGGLHCQVRADERPENAGCFGSGIDQADGRCFSLIHFFGYYGRICARSESLLSYSHPKCKPLTKRVGGMRKTGKLKLAGLDQ